MLTQVRNSLATLLLAAGSVLLVTAAQAQTARFVSSAGDNANNCTREFPCRTLQRGINKTAAGGELQILDSGVYGNSVTIDRSITISAVGVAATAGSILINAPGATVVLRGLLLNGTAAAPGAQGIGIVDAATVHLVDCQVERFPTNGIIVTADNIELSVANSTIRSNSQHGFLVNTFSSGARVTITGSRFENHGGSGIRNVGSGTGQMTIENSVSFGNLAGVHAGNGAVVRISNSVVTGNTTGLENSGGTLLSRGNNTVSGNTTETSGTITALGGI